jgi:hypothetical protein
MQARSKVIYVRVVPPHHLLLRQRRRVAVVSLVAFVSLLLATAIVYAINLGMRKALLEPERQRMLQMSKDGHTKEAIMKKFRRSHGTVCAVLGSPPVRRHQARVVEAVNLALEKANSAAPEVVALTAPGAPSHALEDALTNLRATLRAAAPGMRSFTMNVETGEVDVEVVQRVRLSC